VTASGSANKRTSGTGQGWAYQWVDRRLKVLSVLLPVAFILGLEVVHYAIEARDGMLNNFWDGYRPGFIGVTIASIIAFGLVMFRFIDRAQRQVVRQNRELTAMNAVSSAVKGEDSVDRIIDVALESLLATSGATSASVTVFSTEDRSPEGAGVTRLLLAPPGSAVLVPSDPGGSDAPVIDFPLSTGTVTVGRMQLWLPAGAGADDRLASGTLQNIGHQLASAIQLGQLVADLQRRKHEGHAFYDVLVQISNQVAPPASFADGAHCIAFGVAQGHQPHGPEVDCSVRSSPDWLASLTVPIRGPIGLLGDLWIGRRSDTPFTDRDRAFLITLSGLAAIAITSAQIREAGRQRAVLAERGRIAREMHDSLAQVLGVTHLRLRALDSRAEVRDNPEIAKELTEVADICQEAYQDVRESILGLRSSNKTERALVGNLRAYLAKYSQQCEIRTSLDNAAGEDLALSPRCEVQVIRVIQEALTNVRKHSGAGSAIVHITQSDVTTTFVVEDDGHGFNLNGSLSDRDGFGLFTMRERMGLLDGSLTVDSAPGRGTRVIAEVPERSHPRPAAVEVTGAGG